MNYDKIPDGVSISCHIKLKRVADTKNAAVEFTIILAHVDCMTSYYVVILYNLYLPNYFLKQYV